MRRRVDEGRLQLLRQRRLLQQKQQLVERGECVLSQHCRATWHRAAAAAPPQHHLAALDSAAVHSLEARCCAGQWWLRAGVSLPCELHQRLADGTIRASLLAASPACGLMCRQQQCAPGSTSGNSAPAAPDRAQDQLRLTALLDVQQQQPGDAWADVFLLVEPAEEPDLAAAAASGSSAALAAALTGPHAAPPLLLGRVQLGWQEWLRSHSSDGAASEPPAALQPPQVSRALAVEAQQLDLGCLHQIAQQRLGCTEAGGSGSGSSRVYLLKGGASGAAAASGTAPTAVALRITQHGAHFAEVELTAGSRFMLDVAAQQLEQGLRQAAAAAGLPAGDARLAPSLLSPQHTQLQAAAADALVAELDASIEWVEAVLKAKAAAGSQLRRHKAAPDPAATRRAQAAALAAMAHADAAMVLLLTC